MHKTLTFFLTLCAATAINTLIFSALLTLNQTKKPSAPQIHHTNLTIIPLPPDLSSLPFHPSSFPSPPSSLIPHPSSFPPPLPQPKFDPLNLDTFIDPHPSPPKQVPILIDQTPQPIYTPQPQYPTQALSPKTSEVTVTIEFIINTKGRVENITTNKTTDPIFFQAVKNAVQQWQFTQPTHQNKPVKFRAKKTFHFKIKP